MDWGVIRGLGTLLLMLGFIGLCIWVYSPRQRRRFEEAARLPFRDENRSASTDGGSGDE